MVPFARRLQDLGAWLADTRPVWFPQPIKALPPSWESDRPELAAWARGLDAETLEAVEFRPWDHPACPNEIRGWRERALDLAALPLLAAREVPWQPEDTRWVPGRKWSQLTRFAGTVLPLLDGVPHVVDWCAGKGHLGRALSHWSGLPVVGIERQAALCENGTRMARRRGVNVTLQQGDVLDPATTLPSVTGGALVALHACGPLTDAALAHADQGDARLAAVSPCCLQALGEGPYVPRSRAAAAVALPLERSDLFLAMGEERIATPRLRLRRRTELAWRSGLHLILQELCGRPDWTRVPSQPSSTWGRSFQAFCRSVHGFEGIALPEDLDFAAYETRGWARSREARALGIARGLFRRPLEVFVALDRSQALAERGWAVDIGTFCSPDVTPRNVLIVARR